MIERIDTRTPTEDQRYLFALDWGLFFLVFSILLSACKTNLNLPEPDKKFMDEDFPRFYCFPITLLTEKEVQAFEESIGGKLVLKLKRSDVIATDRRLKGIVNDHNKIDEYPKCFGNTFLYKIEDTANSIVIFHYYNFNAYDYDNNENGDNVSEKFERMTAFTILAKSDTEITKKDKIEYAQKLNFIIKKWAEYAKENATLSRIDTGVGYTIENFQKGLPDLDSYWFKKYNGLTEDSVDIYIRDWEGKFSNKFDELNIKHPTNCLQIVVDVTTYSCDYDLLRIYGR